MKRKWFSFTAMTAIFALLATFIIPTQTQAASPYQIEIADVKNGTDMLYLYKNGKIIKSYPVATDRETPDAKAPNGVFPIITKFVNPGWTSPEGKFIKGGTPENPLGTRWLGIQVNGDSGRTYGIHGTNDPSSIGKDASSGCNRLHNKDVEELYNIVPIGTEVWIHDGPSNGKWKGKGTATKPAQPKESSYTGQLTASKSLINIRASSSLSSSILQQVGKGTKLNAVAKAGEFYKIKLKSGKHAYVHNSVVTQSKGSSSSSQGKTNQTIKTRPHLSNIRASASLNAPILQRVNKNTSLQSIGKTGAFYKIKLKSGQVAYIHQSVIK